MKKLNFRLPNYDLVFGYDNYFGKDKNQKQSIIFEKRGTKAKITDYATILSCMYEIDELTNEKNGSYWLEDNSKNDALILYQNGNILYSPINKRIIGLRPIINYSDIKDMCFNEKMCDDGVLETYFGSYPNNVCDEKVKEELEKIYKYNLGIGIMTNKNYTIDKVDSYHDHKLFFKRIVYEYMYEGKKYIRIPVNNYLSHTNDGVTLSDGKFYDNNSHIWIEVTPHKMLVDEKNNIAIFENIVLSGIQFNKIRNYKGDFENTTMKKYLDKYFSNEILPNTKYVDNDINTKIRKIIK